MTTMTNSNPPIDDRNARREDAAPPPQPSPHANQVIAELPADVPVELSAGTPVNTTAHVPAELSAGTPVIATAPNPVNATTTTTTETPAEATAAVPAAVSVTVPEAAPETVPEVLVQHNERQESTEQTDVNGSSAPAPETAVQQNGAQGGTGNTEAEASMNTLEIPAQQQNGTQESIENTEDAATPTTPRMKSEGSAYASSYRPQESQSDPPPPIPTEEHYNFNSGQADNSPTSHHHHHHLFHHESQQENSQPDQPPPAYSEIPGTIANDNSHLGANAEVASDGRVNIRISQKSRVLSQLIVPQLQRQISHVEDEAPPPPPYVPEFLGGAPGQRPPPSLNVVIQVVGSRGDVQPFVALGKVLKETYGHRVRLATHPTFKDFVTENGLEFFSIGGDPAELMAFMVKNPGLMPGFDTLRSGEVGKRRRGIAEIMRGTWRSCIETGDGIGIDPLKQTVEEWMGVEDQLPEQLRKPFVADAIIANPPSFGHLHCAEKLGIPLHMMFTMPWSPTQKFPHPLANVQASNADQTITNFVSYILVDMLTWQGLGDVVNRFRKDVLGLDPISMVSAPAMLARLKIPWTYCWSPALIPKPKDWGVHISVAGFYFLSLAQNYTPAPELAEFLAAGEPPVYIGFGSIVVDDPNAMTELIFEAVKKTGRRALVSKGWGGLGADELGVPEGVFMLGNCPHDWLFKQVAAVVHHGGAGTTAAGIAAGRPTVVVPFFGDQPFWGQMTARAGAGPEPVPYKDLTADKLANAINEALKPESLERAKELSEKISQEQGSQNGAQYFHQMLNIDELRCAAAPKYTAVWRVKRTKVVLSAKAATVLAQEGELSFSELKLFRPRDYVPDGGPIDPFSGAASALVGTATQMLMGIADFPIETMRLLNIAQDNRSKKGKEKAKDTDTGSASEATRRGRTTESREDILSQTSAASSTTELPGVQTPDSSDGRNRGTTEYPGMSTPTSPTTPTHRSAFMAQAMAATNQRSRSQSQSRRNRQFSPIERRPTRADSIANAEMRSIAGSSNSDRTFSEKLSSMNTESVALTGKGIGRIVGAGVRSPMDFSLNIAKGFHNVPKLLGSEVRQVDRVTDLQSGLKTAAKEFGFGLYDGIAGIVTDPYKGAKKEGSIGFVKGVGRGLFNVPWRVMGGAWSVPAYAMKGLYQEILKDRGNSVQNYIIAARISQGYDETLTISAAERADIVNRWKCIRLNVKKKKMPGEESMETLQHILSERRRKKRERVGKLKDKAKRADSISEHPTILERQDSNLSDVSEVPERTPGGLSSHPVSGAPTYPIHSPIRPLQFSGDEKTAISEREAVIASTVAETSRGNAQEDELISRAIRASMIELQREPEPGEDEEAMLQRALTASLEEAQRSGVSEEEQRVLEETLRQSLLESSSGRRRSRRDHGSDSEWDSSDTEDDEDYQRIIAESQKLAELHKSASHDEYYSTVAGALDEPELTEAQKEEEEALRKALEESAQAPSPTAAAAEEEEAFRKALEESAQAHAQAPPNGTAEDDEEALRKAIEESEKAEEERMAQLEKQRTEEDIILEYIKKQSLAEEQHRRRWIEGRDTHGESSGAGASGSGSGSGSGGGSGGASGSGSGSGQSYGW